MNESRPVSDRERVQVSSSSASLLYAGIHVTIVVWHGQARPEPELSVAVKGNVFLVQLHSAKEAARRGTQQSMSVFEC